MVRDDQVVLPDGSHVSFRNAGPADGPVVLYFHGTPGSRKQLDERSDAVAHQLGLRLVALDRPGYGGSSFVRYRVGDYPAIVERFADAIGVDRFGVVGTSGGGRYAYACGQALPHRVRRVALVASTAPPDVPEVRGTWSRSDRRLYAAAARAPWLLRVAMSRTARRLRDDPRRMLSLLPTMSAADERAVARPEVRATIVAMTEAAFDQGARAFVHDVRLEAVAWGVPTGTITPPVDIWHGRDDTIVRCTQAEVVADRIPGSRRHFLPDEGHFSLVMLRQAEYLRPFTG